MQIACAIFRNIFLIQHKIQVLVKMADSDDEYDRKRRDKFRGERERSSGDYNRSDRRDDRPRGREEWADR